MNTKTFSLGSGLNLTLYETPELYFGPVNIKIWRELMPNGTLRSGLDSVCWDLNFDDFRNDRDNLNTFLDELSYRLGKRVELFCAADLGPALANELYSKGASLNSFMVVIRK